MKQFYLKHFSNTFWKICVNIKTAAGNGYQPEKGGKLSMLRTVWYKIEENRTARSEQIFRTLAEKGIPCQRIEQERKKGAEYTAENGTESENPGGLEEKQDFQEILVLTDDRALVRQASQKKIACVGVAGADTTFFEGADLVVEDPEELELRGLEEYLCHCCGVPVTIAQTKRLTLREMTEDDWQALDRISRQRGMEKARRDAEEDGTFGKERLAAYIGSQYRLYGYGLWTVALMDDGGSQSEKTADKSENFQKSREEEAAVLQKDSRSANEKRTETIQQVVRERMDEQKENVIGCCGFSELNENLESVVQAEQPVYGTLCTDSEHLNFSGAFGPVLELQYMLDEAYRRQGYGTEMCRAAIAYAYEYLEANEIWVRVRSDYPEALSFARALGFRPIERETKFSSHTVEDTFQLSADAAVERGATLSNHTVDAGGTWSGSGDLCVKKEPEDTKTICDRDFSGEHTSGIVSLPPWHIVWLRHERPHL